MYSIEELRNKIDIIDDKILDLFLERMVVARSIATYKIENDMKIFDEDREKEVLEKNLEKIRLEEYKKYTEKFLNNLMDISKDLQKDIIDGVMK